MSEEQNTEAPEAPEVKEFDPLDSLGLGDIPADPNWLPEKRFDAEVYQSDLVVVEAQNKVSHVFTYRVDSGEFNGRQRQEWYDLGSNPVVEDGKVVSYTPTMSTGRKGWYKSRLLALSGLSEAEFDQNRPPISDYVGKKVTIGIKHNGQYVNVNFVELRGDDKPAATTTEENAEGSKDPFVSAVTGDDAQESQDDPDF